MNMMNLLPLFLAVGALAQVVDRPVETFSTREGPLKIVPIHHASLMMEANGQVVHVDPWSQGNYDSLPQADIILITDIHPDHLDPKILTRLRKPSTVIFAPEAVAKTVDGATIMRNGDTKTFGKWTFEAIPMYNEKRGPEPGKRYHDKGRGNGYTVTYGGFHVYISGDTEGTPEMRSLKSIDVAFIAMNLPYTMPPEEAAEAVKQFHPKIVYPYHYRDSDLSKFEKALSGSGIEVRLRNWYY